MKARIKQMLLMKKSMPEICDTIAKSLIIKYDFKTISGKKQNDIFIYNEGIFIERGRDVIEQECEEILGTLARTHTVNEIRNKIERLTKIYREELGCEDKNLICLNNGVLNIKTKRLLDHSPKFRFKSKILVDYDKKAHCPKILNFLSELLLEDDVKCIQEWIGYQVYREYFIKKASIFRGVPDTGKTAFLNLLIRFIGIDNIADKSLQRLAEGKWQAARLYGKHSNIGDDLSDEDVGNMGVVKQLTGRSRVDAEFKFGDSFEFVNYAKLSFGCNKIPRIRGDVDDQAFWDRWMIFDFENKFSKKDINTNPHIVEDITTKEELSGLLNWSLEGLERLFKQGYFSYRRHWEDNRNIMQGEASSIARFNNECLMFDSESWISNGDIFSKYEEFCGLNNITPETNQMFFKEIRRFCNFGRFGVQKGSGIYGVSYVKVKEILSVMGL